MQMDLARHILTGSYEVMVGPYVCLFCCQFHNRRHVAAIDDMVVCMWCLSNLMPNEPDVFGSFRTLHPVVPIPWLGAGGTF